MGKWHVLGSWFKHQGSTLMWEATTWVIRVIIFPYNGKWRMTRKHPYTHWNTLPNGKPGEYLTDRLTVEAESSSNKTKSARFLYPSYYSVHTVAGAERARGKIRKNRKASGTEMLHTRRW